MIRKITAVVAALAIALSALTVAPIEAFARHGGGGGGHGGGGHGGGHGGGGGGFHGGGGFLGGGGHVAARSFSAGPRAVVHNSNRIVVRNHSVRTGRFAGGHHFNHRRHFWHGRWWAYGVGSCWAFDDTYDEYYWACDDD